MRILKDLTRILKRLRRRISLRRRMADQARRARALAEPRRFFRRKTSSIISMVTIGSRNVRTTGINLSN